MALTIGSGTFTNGSVTVSGVTFSSGGASFISSGTLLGVGVSPMDRQVEAISATTNTITLREAWSGTTGAKQFTAAYTTEGLRDAVDAARGFSEQLANRSTATTTDMQAATNDVKIATPLKVKQAIDFNTGTAATRDVGEAAGNVMEVGAFGVGGLTPLTTEDLTGIEKTGFYWYGTGATNKPTTTDGHLINISRVSTVSVNLAIPKNQTELYIQNINSSNDWVKTYHTGNILGTVSQSGGVPTGAIIERGSNVNGEYTKLADGTMICNYIFPYVTAAAMTVAGKFHKFGDWTYPSVFSSTPAINITGLNNGVNTYSTAQASGCRLTSLSSCVDIYTAHMEAGNSVSVGVSCTAIGRWI